MAPQPSTYTRAITWLQASPLADVPPPSRLQMGMWAILTILTLALALSNFDAIQVGVNRDDAEYVILTRSLVQSDRYGQMNAPGEPTPSRFPFGFPLLLTPFQLLWPNNFEALKALPLAATLINLSLLFWGWRWFTRQPSYWWALAVAALYAFSPLTIGQARVIMSESVFLTETLLALILTEKLRRANQTGLWAFVLGALLALTIFTRTIGVILVVACVAYLLLCRGRAGLIMTGQLFAGLVGALILIIALTPVRLADLIPLEYLQQLSAPAQWGQTQIEAPLLQRFFGALREYGEQHFRAMIFPLGGGTNEAALAARWGVPFLPALLGWLFTIVLVVGAVTLLVRERLSAFWLFALFYFWPIVLWPWRGPRFLYPIYPQILLAYLLGGELFLALLFKRLAAQNRLRPAIATTLVSAFLIVTVYKSLTLDSSIPHVGDFTDRTAWLRANTPANTIVYTEEAVIDYIYGLHPTVAEEFHDAALFEKYLADNQVAYVLIAPEVAWQTTYAPHYSPRAQQTLLWLQDLSQQGQAQLVYELPGENVKVYKVGK